MTHTPTPYSRRHFLHTSLAGLGSLPVLASLPTLGQSADAPVATPKGKPTQFQFACMTLPYSNFPLQRALTGLKSAGYRYVAWGTTHREDPASEQRTAVLAADAPPEKAKELSKRCRDLGLEPVMMFSGVSPDAANGVEMLKKRLLQAAAGGLKQVLTFGGSKSQPRKVWVDNLKQIIPVAKDNRVLLVVKQHGGDTGTGEGCAQITREVGSEWIKVNFDSGNVLDYSRGKVDPLADLAKCADEVRSFCIKDHRLAPWDQDCGPGLGDIDHYRLLKQVAFTGLEMPLCCENISAPGLPRPTQPEVLDAWAKRAREFLELVVQSLQYEPAKSGAK